MTKLGKINFNDYDSDSDESIRISKYTSPSINCNRFAKSKPVFSKNKTDITNLSCNEKSSSNKDKYQKCNIDSFESESESESESSNSSFYTKNKYRVGNCDIITYDNSKDYSNLKKTSQNRIKRSFKKQKKKLSNNNISDNDDGITDYIECSSSFKKQKKKLSNNNISDNDDGITDYIECSSSFDRINLHDKYVPDLSHKSPSLEKKCETKDNINLYDDKICNFGQLDIVGRKLKKILESFKTISYLIQYYLRMLEQVKIEVSNEDISYAINSCIETTASLASYIKADIQRNKTFVLDDKYNNRDGYYLTNGLTKIYYIDKIKLSLLKNGEFIFGIYEEKKGLRDYELGNDYASINYEGDLYTMIDIAKEKGIHFNKYIQNKYMKVTSIFNLHLIYLNKYKI
jgi:hypothetical protein